MTTTSTIALAELAEKGADVDVLRQMVQFMAQRLMEIDVEGLRSIEWGILKRTPAFLREMFEHLSSRRVSMNDQEQATRLLETGKRALTTQDWDEVRAVCGRLWDLLPSEQKAEQEMRLFTGLV